MHDGVRGTQRDVFDRGARRRGGPDVRRVVQPVRLRLPALSRAMGLGVALAFHAACGPPPIYQQPALDEPHAVLKVRVSYHATLPTTLEESMTLAGYTLPAPGPAELSPRHFVRAFRVQPGLQTLRIRTHFFHNETRSHVESYYETQRYACGTTRSGYGSSSYSTTQYCSRSMPRTRTVYRTVRVTDALCERQAPMDFPPQSVFFVEYDFYGHGQCSTRCMLQTPDANGGFSFTPCRPVAVQ